MAKNSAHPFLGTFFIAASCLLGPLRPSAAPSPSAAKPLGTPEAVLTRFDSLLNSSRPENAKALLVGSAERMFDLILLSNAKLKPFIDTLRSSDSILENRREGGRAGLKVAGKVVFTKPVMGMDSLVSTQIIHFLAYHERWRISAFIEAPDAETPLSLPTIEDSLAAMPALGKRDSADAMGYFPVSRHALAPGQSADSMLLSLRLRPGTALPPLAARDPLQTPAGRDKAGHPAVMTRKPPWPGPALAYASLRSDSLARYLASTPYLDLSDTALTALAKRLKRGTRTPQAYVTAVYAYLVKNFDYALGASLFGTSREALARMRGDCSEAAVLTAALLRAEGIPSRVAMGFATVGDGAFIGHAWCEAWLGQWVGVDAALKELPAGVQRLRLAVSDGSGNMRVEATNLVLQVLGNLNIEIAGAWRRGQPLPLVKVDEDPALGRRFFEETLNRAMP